MGRVGKKIRMKVIRNFLACLPKGVDDVLVDERIDEIEGHLKLLRKDIGSITSVVVRFYVKKFRP
ncbi:TPA: hypothetical protein I7759_14585 [Vibrio vulnificus]|nr:hypothetical protein [Vibrio vulnificus]